MLQMTIVQNKRGNHKEQSQGIARRRRSSWNTANFYQCYLFQENIDEHNGVGKTFRSRKDIP